MQGFGVYILCMCDCADHVVQYSHGHASPKGLQWGAPQRGKLLVFVFEYIQDSRCLCNREYLVINVISHLLYPPTQTNKDTPTLTHTDKCIMPFPINLIMVNMLQINIQYPAVHICPDVCTAGEREGNNSLLMYGGQQKNKC